MTDNKNKKPNHWNVKKLEELLPYVIGGDWGKDESFLDPDFSFAYCIRSSEIKNWKEDKGKTAALRKVKTQSIQKRKLQDGDIIIEISGGGPEQPVGRTLLVDKYVLAYNPNIPKICTNFFRLIRPSDDINSSFLDLYLKFFYASGEVVKFQAGSNNLRNLKFNDYLTIDIPIPPLSEQKAIVEKIEELFSELDNGIEELRTAQDQLKVYRQSLLKWAFEGRLTNDNVDEGKLPKGWKWVYIQDITAEEKHALKAGPFGSSLKKEFYTPSGYKIYGQEQVISGDPFYGDYFISKEKYQELKSNKVHPNDILISLVGTVGKVLILPENCESGIINPRLVKITLNKDVYIPKFFKYYFESSFVKSFYSGKAQGTTMDVLNLGIIKTIPFVMSPISEQQKIVEILEEKLSVCDQMEQIITQSLQQAKSLRQSILKQAFEGKLVTAQKQAPAYVPKNKPFFQAQLFGYIIDSSAKNNIDHGEMTLAKNAYLLDKIYGVPTYFNYQRWHLGPYPPEMKGVLNGGSLKQFFSRVDYHIELQNSEKLFKYTNPYELQVREAMDDLSAIISQYEDKERSFQTELLATVCKVIEDIQTTDLKAARASMKEWKIDLKTTKHKNKAEKFSESDTASCLNFIISKGWDKKLIN